MTLDVDRLARAIIAARLVAPVLTEADVRGMSEDLAREYARLAPPADFDALAASGNRYSLKEEAERNAEGAHLNDLAAQREQRRQTRTPK